MKGSTPWKLDPTCPVIASPPPGTASVAVITVPGGKGQFVGNVPSSGTETGASVLMHAGVGWSDASTLPLPHADVSATASDARMSPLTRDRGIILVGRSVRT